MNRQSRRRNNKIFKWACVFMTLLSVFILLVLLAHICEEGWRWLSPHFVTNFPSRFPEKAGIKSAIFGSLWLI